MVRRFAPWCYTELLPKPVGSKAKTIGPEGKTLGYFFFVVGGVTLLIQEFPEDVQFQ